MATTTVISAGTQLAFFSQVDSTGKMTSWNGSRSTSNGVAAGMRQFYGIKQANPAIVEPEFVPVTGDDGAIGKIDFPPGDTPEWIMEVAISDLETVAQLQGTIVQTIGQAYFGAFQPTDPVYPDICVVYNSKAKNYGVGTKAWQGVIFPVCSAVPLDRDAYNERTAATYRYKMLAQAVTKTPWGVTINSANNGTDSPVGLNFQSDNPIIIQAYIGNGSTTEFFTQKTPVSVAKTIVWTGNGAVATVNSVNTTTKSFTLSGAPANNTDVLVMMEFTP